MGVISDYAAELVAASIVGLAYLWTWIYINRSRQRLFDRVAEILTEP